MRNTIRQVAIAAGVSVTTVSRVVNDEPYVRPDTRRKVEAAIAALGFRPSSAARALAGQRAFQIALIYDNPSPYYIQQIQSGVRGYCSERGYRVVFQDCNGTGPRLVEEIAELINETHLDGVILAPPVCDVAGVLDELARRQVRFVRMVPGDAPSEAPFVTMDDAAAAEEITDHLVALGHRDIGFIIGIPDHVASIRRRAGFRRALERHGIAADPARELQGLFSFDSGLECGRRLLKCTPRPTAVFASNDHMAAGVLSAAHELGLSVPGDVAVAGFDDSDFALLVWPQLTTVRQPLAELAYAGARLLLDDGAVSGEVLPYQLVPRASTQPPRS